MPFIGREIKVSGDGATIASEKSAWGEDGVEERSSNDDTDGADASVCERPCMAFEAMPEFSSATGY